MFTTAFLLASLERAVKTFAQSLAALLVADGTNLLTTNWGDRVSIAGMAAVVSVLTSVASGATGSGPSATNAETLTPAVAAVEAPTGRDTPGTSRPELVAGPAADVPEGEPVDVTEAPKDDDPKPLGGYWGGV